MRWGWGSVGLGGGAGGEYSIILGKVSTRKNSMYYNMIISDQMLMYEK